MSNTITKNKLLQKLCELTAEIPWGYDPKIYSYKDLAKRLEVSVYQIRKVMKELEADGLVCKTYDGGADEEGYPYCIHGWAITTKVLNSETYKDIERKAIDKFKRWEREFQEKWEAEHE